MTGIRIHPVVDETTCEGLCEEHICEFGTAIATEFGGTVEIVQGFEINSIAWDEGFVSDGGYRDDSGRSGRLETIEEGCCEDEVAIFWGKGCSGKGGI
jgi:hypothetical protein